ncbi:hypothetical protein WN71_037625 [Streptomyces mangrovisoli]|uniref:Uncharacterized protein n=1 Tax=Streptomyces mangrovisoli TaxID=1428628 RepID=A0A1J4NKU7_9ACTN|nr:hypothetical protein WN71_037625 [Streptomyces mangrovisoli]
MTGEVFEAGEPVGDAGRAVHRPESTMLWAQVARPAIRVRGGAAVESMAADRTNGRGYRALRQGGKSQADLFSYRLRTLARLGTRFL